MRPAPFFALALCVGCSGSPDDTGVRDAPPIADGGISPLDASPADATPACLTPTDPAALFEFLKSGAYRDWTHEAMPHESQSKIHAQRVQVYANPVLAAGFSTDGEHPRCGTLIKEFRGQNSDVVTGWAVSVKLQETSDKGQGWYWFETFDAQTGRPATSGVGARICTGCHGAARDYVLSPWPFQ